MQDNYKWPGMFCFKVPFKDSPGQTEERHVNPILWQGFDCEPPSVNNTPYHCAKPLGIIYKM
jgi:hypothetical protein